MSPISVLPSAFRESFMVIIDAMTFLVLSSSLFILSGSGVSMYVAHWVLDEVFDSIRQEP